MPQVTAKPRSMMGGDIVTEFMDSVGTSSVTYTYPLKQNKLTVKNIGNSANLSFTVGSTTKTLAPGELYFVNTDFTSFSIQSASGIVNFIATSQIENDTEDRLSAVQAANENNYKVINVRNNYFANCKFDGTDDYANLIAIINGIKDDPDPIELWFPPHQNPLLLSDKIKITRGNIRLNIQSNIQFTKTVNTLESPMLCFEIIGTATVPIENVSVVGNKTNWIDGNGHNCTSNTITYSSLGGAQTLAIRYAKYVFVADIQINHGYKDCLSISYCQHGLVKNVECHESTRDNGISINYTPTWITYDVKDPTTYSDILVEDCRAYDCTDIGFSQIRSAGVTFNRCKAYNCGNDFDNNAGGGFSFEVLWATINERSLQAKVIDCEANNCKNYGFYATGVDIDFVRCKVNGVTATATSGDYTRLGSGWMIGTQKEGKVSFIDCEVKSESLVYGLYIVGDPNFDNTLEINGFNVLGDCEYGIFGFDLRHYIIKNVNVKKASKAPVKLYSAASLANDLGDIGNLQADTDGNGIANELVGTAVSGTLNSGTQKITASGTTSVGHYSEVSFANLDLPDPKVGDKIYCCGLFSNPNTCLSMLQIYNKKSDGAMEEAHGYSAKNDGTFEFISAILPVTSLSEKPSILFRQRIVKPDYSQTFIAAGENISFKRLYLVNLRGYDITKAQLDTIMAPLISTDYIKKLPITPRGTAKIKDVSCDDGASMYFTGFNIIEMDDIYNNFTTETSTAQWAVEVQNSKKVVADNIKVISLTSMSEYAIKLGTPELPIDDAWITNIKTNKAQAALLNVTNNHT